MPQPEKEHLLVEQLRLLLGNMPASLVGASLLSILLAWIFSGHGNTTVLSVWLGLMVFANLFTWLLARRYLMALSSGVEQARRLTWKLILFYAARGALWGALSWIAQDTVTLSGMTLLIISTAGLCGGAVALMSPVLPVFTAFTALLVMPLIARLWLLGAEYRLMGMMAMLFVITLLMQARNSSRAARTAIELRFKNIDLIGRLHIETENAQVARREAEYANTAKSRFLAAASHDLRQPIHAQGLFLGVLSRTELNAHQREVLASANAASKASGEMLNTLLDFSRIEAGVIKPAVRPFRLQPLLNKIENELAPQADAKGIVYRSRETHLAVLSDPALVELILRNLVSNALRYTERGGLLVACRKRDHQAVLEVWDTGVGIAPAHQQEVFREFHQLGNPERDRCKGLGLGLAIARGLARTLGHCLSLASTPQRGSVFRLSLPIVGGSLPAEERRLTQRKTQMLNVRVLVIDDDETVRAGMFHLLHDWGCKCDVAGSIEDALGLARIHAPDLVISDYRLREQRTGAEAIAALRALLDDNLPALLITGDTAPDLLREAQASGIPILHKPVSPGQLYHGVVGILGKRRSIEGMAS